MKDGFLGGESFEAGLGFGEGAFSAGDLVNEVGEVAEFVEEGKVFFVGDGTERGDTATGGEGLIGREGEAIESARSIE